MFLRDFAPDCNRPVRWKWGRGIVGPGIHGDPVEDQRANHVVVDIVQVQNGVGSNRDRGGRMDEGRGDGQGACLDIQVSSGDVGFRKSESAASLFGEITDSLKVLCDTHIIPIRSKTDVSMVLGTMVGALLFILIKVCIYIN